MDKNEDFDAPASANEVSGTPRVAGTGDAPAGGSPEMPSYQAPAPAGAVGPTPAVEPKSRKKLAAKVAVLALAGVLAGGAGVAALAHTSTGSSQSQMNGPGGMGGQGGGMGQRGNMVRGILVSITSSSVTVKTDTSEQTFTLASDVQVNKDGGAGSVTDLKVGDIVMLGITTEDSKKIVERIMSGDMPRGGPGGTGGQPPADAGQGDGQPPAAQDQSTT